MAHVAAVFCQILILYLQFVSYLSSCHSILIYVPQILKKQRAELCELNVGEGVFANFTNDL